MLQAEYVRDMHNNYLVLKGIEGSVSIYGTKMLLNNIIRGVIKTELRCIDHMDLFYYDISSKKSIATVCGNKSLNYDEIKKILSNILEIIENSGEYLLSENDFIIEPNYVFIDNVSQNIELCHLIGRQENIREQLSRFIEYLMDKADYKDEAAVLLIYAMYKESKEDDCTFEKLLKELNKKNNNNVNIRKIEIIKENQTENQINNQAKNQLNNQAKKQSNNQVNNHRDNPGKLKKTEKYYKQKSNNNKQGIQKIKSKMESSPKVNFQSQYQNFMKKLIGEYNKSPGKAVNTIPILEEVESEREIFYFGRKTFIMAGISIISGIIMFILAFQLKILHNSFGTHIDTVKLFCSILIIGCVEVYIITKLFDQKYKLTRMETNIEYIEQSREEGHGIERNAVAGYGIQGEGAQDRIQDYEVGGQTQLLWMDKNDFDESKTEILGEVLPRKQYYIVECNTVVKSEIPVNKFPFIIGKSEKAVNLIIRDASVSRRHAKLTREGDSIYLTDLSSTNGTYVNCIRLTENEPYLISDKDEISFSQVKYFWKCN